MSVVYVPTGSTEVLHTTVYSSSTGTGLTGAASTTKVSIMRASDQKQLDFSDNTFKSSGWTTRQQSMTEVDATNAPGEYIYSWNTSLITNAVANDVYFILIDQVGVLTAANLPQTGEIRVGALADKVNTNLDATVSGVPTAVANLDISAHTNAKLLGGAITRLRKWLTWTTSTLNKKRVNTATQKIEIYDDDGTTLLDNPVIADSTGSTVTPQTGELSRIG